MQKIILLLSLLSFAIPIFSQANCLKVIKKNKKEYTILVGQKIRLELLNKKNRLKSTKCVLLKVSESNITAKQLRGELNQPFTKKIEQIEYLGFKTRCSRNWGNVNDLLVLINLFNSTGANSHITGQYKVEYFHNEKWELNTSSIDYTSINPKRKTAIIHRLRK